ncbi:Retrovirus-related Pol polyprotein from transposon TNT 1-94, partial [Durusdinium trenchii]
DLKIQVETLAFKHLGNEITQQRVDGVTEAFLELMQQNVAELPPGAVNVWQKMLTYTGSCCRYISATYTDRLKIIQEDWAVIQSAQHETESNEEEKVTRSFGGMCAFSNEVIGQPTEGWMEDLLLVFSAAWATNELTNESLGTFEQIF